MNNEILKAIKINLKETMKLMNFKIKGQSYIRVVNKQIYQELNFQGSSSGSEFTVNIAIVPICGVKVPCYNPITRIGTFINGEDKWWNYSMEAVNEVVEIINDRILPMFDTLSTYEALYEEIESEINYIPRSEKNWRNPKVDILYNMGTMNLFWICFRNNRYDKCKIVLKNAKIEIFEWLDACLKSAEYNIKNTTSKKYKKIFEDNKEHYKALAQDEIKNIDELNELLENNEIEKMLEMTNEIEVENIETFKKFVF